MSECCENSEHPLTRDGISQAERQPQALPPDYVKVEERTLADRLVFAYRFAEKLIYHDTNAGKTDNNWQPFFQCSHPVQVALIAKTDTAALKKELQMAFALVEEMRDEAALRTLFDRLIGLAAQLNNWLRDLEKIPGGFNEQVANIIGTEAHTALKSLANLDLAAVTYFEIYPATEWAYNPAQYQPFTTEKAWGFQVPTTVAGNQLFGFTGSFYPDTAAVRRELERLYSLLWKSLMAVVNRAPAYLEKNLWERQDHQPHIALYIAFLELMQQVENDLNNLTKRHLDFFYKDVLRLVPKKAVPDKAHLLFELAKHVQEYKIAEGVTFSAGKDALGNGLFYKLNEELIANKAHIAQLKTVFQRIGYEYLDAEGNLLETPQRYFKTTHAAPVANSADGMGADFEKGELPLWSTLGNQNQPLFAQGFAIPSDMLWLQEGIRIITLTIDVAPESWPTGVGAEVDKLVNSVRCYLTTEEGWTPVDLSLTAEVGGIIENAGILILTATSQLAVKLLLPEDFPPVIGFDKEALPDDTYDTAEPMLKVLFDPELMMDAARLDATNEKVRAYHYLKDLRINNLTLDVQVLGVKTLLLQSELAIFDPAKPFTPFGSVPKKGTNFYIAYPEAFQKRLTGCNIAWEWEKPEAPLTKTGYYAAYEKAPSEETEFTASVSVLAKNGNKIGFNALAAGGNLTLFNDAQVHAVAFTEAQSDYFAAQPFVPWEAFPAFGTESDFGFLRCSLDRTFLHEDYVQTTIRQNLALAKEAGAQAAADKLLTGAFYKKGNQAPVQYNGSNISAADAPSFAVVVPNPPYVPTMKNLTLNYSAQDAISAFYQVHPFNGYKEIQWEEGAAAFDQAPILPQNEEEGMLMVGISQLQPPQVLPILFQVAEDSADPELPTAEVQWQYLTDAADWQPFQDFQLLEDGTNNLSRSGVVKLEVPKEIGTQNTLLPKGLYWLRAVVHSGSAAVCKTLGAHLQVAESEFEDRGNDPQHLAKPLPAGSISKPEVTDPSIKTVLQPYDSFGGRTAEADGQFYTRVSEHLRHKGRAITLFDYERMVLDQFTIIYKAKCINHTQSDAPKIPGGERRDRQLVPGSVTIAVVPDLTNRTAEKRLQPKATLAELSEIKAWLQKRISPFVKLEVVNPDYYRIKVDFSVRFRPGKSAGYYQKVLNEAIIGFLSPWAFENSAEVNFGGKVFASSILNFVEEQEYVDFVTDFKMLPVDEPESGAVVELTAKTARTIMVSVQQHSISVIENPDELPHQQPSKNKDKHLLGYMQVGEGFKST